MDKLNAKQIAIAKEAGWTICDREIKDPTTFYQTLRQDGETDLLRDMQRAAADAIDPYETATYREAMKDCK